MEAILRIALTTDGGKWMPGTVLAVHGCNEEVKNSFGPGDMASFFLIRALTGKYDFWQMMDWRLKKAVNLDMILSGKSKTDRIAQKENVQILVNKNRAIILVGEVAHKPRWDKVVNLDIPGMLIDTPKEQWPQDMSAIVDAEVREMQALEEKIKGL